MEVDEVLVSSTDVDFSTAALFDSDKVFLQSVSLRSPITATLTYRVCVVPDELLH